MVAAQVWVVVLILFLLTFLASPHDVSHILDTLLTESDSVR